MSEATRKAMIEAIGAHVGDIMDGAYLMDWVVVGYTPRFGAEQAEASNYWMDGSSPADHILRGLLSVGASTLNGVGEDIAE